MEISAQQVKELREQTNAGMMDCKKALADAEGNVEEAVKLLRERGMAKAATKAGRETSEGVVASYIHPGDKLGVLVEIACETDFVARTEKFRQFTHDVAMQVAASSPLCVRREDIDAKVLDQEREIYRTQAKNEGKPDKILDKIVDGKIEKYFAEVALMEQPFVKDNDKTIGDYLKETIGSLGENIQIKRFCRFRLGE
jgi:elongation factor Ts